MTNKEFSHRADCTGPQIDKDEAAWRELDDERVAYINRIGDILGQVGEDSLEDTAIRVMQRLDASLAREEAYREEVVKLSAEVMEQCRLNGMGSEREAKLMAQRDALLSSLKEISERAKDHPTYIPDMTIEEECDIGGDAAEWSCISRIADEAMK